MADSQYIIDIAAEMPAGAVTIAELDEMAASLTGAGKRSDDFQSAIKRVSEQLDAAKAASVASNAALADGAAQYSILEREAVRAAKALERTQAKGQFDPRAARSAAEAAGALDAYGMKLRGLEQASTGATAAQKKLEAQLGNVNKLASHLDARNAASLKQYRVLGAAVGDLPGPLGRLGRSFFQGERAEEAFEQSFGRGAAVALKFAGVLSLAAVAIAAVTAATVVGAIAFAAYAVSRADALRETNLTREALSGMSEGAEIAVGAFDAVTDATGIGEQGLIDLTKKLLATKKVYADEMPEALLAAAQAEQALGKGGSDAFVDRIKAGTLAVGAFAEEAETKFGGVVAKRLRGLDQQSAKFQRSWRDLFSGVNLEPVLDALQVIVGMFDRANPLAQAMQVAISGAFDPIADNALNAAYAVEAFAIGFAIQATKMYISAKPLFQAFDTLNLSLTGAKESGETFATVAAVIGVSLGIVAVVLGVVLAALLVLPAAAFAVGYAIGFAFTWAIDKALELGQRFDEFMSETWAKFVQFGSDLMTGLASGIMSAVSAVIGAVTSAVTGAIDTAKSLLGIASPSKIFADIGDDTVAGFTGAVDAGSAEASGSMASLVGPSATTPAANANAAAPASGGAGKSFDFGGATFVFHGVANADTAKDKFAAMLTSLLEDDATSLAGAVV